ncbi:MAG: DUF4294 domain-containing protein [Flavobacteriaceae bacterium]
MTQAQYNTLIRLYGLHVLLLIGPLLVSAQVHISFEEEVPMATKHIDSAYINPEDDPALYAPEGPDFYYVIQGDSLAHEQIDLNEVVLLKRLSFTNMEERRRYVILRRKTLKVFPYAKLASDRLTIMEQRLGGLSGKSAQKKYTRRIQKYVEEEFTATLRKFSRSEGRILVKLVERQTGRTTFDLIKTFRSGWNAFWYDRVAGWYDISLKEPYRPFASKEDYYIEDILQRAFRDQLLESQKPFYPIDILALESYWSKADQLVPEPSSPQ